MPVIVFEGSKMEVDKKKELISALTMASAQVTGIAPESFIVYIHENAMDSIGVGGEMLTDYWRRDESHSSEFRGGAPVMAGSVIDEAIPGPLR